jgi:hypothetical protein
MAIPPNNYKYTFFSAVHETFFKIGHILWHKARQRGQENWSSFPYSTTTQCIKLEINNKIKYRIYSNTWTLNNSLLNGQCTINEISGKIKKILESNDNENTTYQNLWGTIKAELRGKFTAKSVNIKKNREI